MAPLKSRNSRARPSKKPPRASPRGHATPARKIALLELLEALARAANEAATPEAAMRTCLERIAEYTNSSLARVAILKADSGIPAVASSMWLERDARRFADLVRASEELDYSRPTGRFISIVLRDQRAVWIEDIARTFTRGRLAPATKAGLHSAFAFPVIVGGKVAAFLEFFAEKPRKADPLLLDAVGSVAAQLARLIERARAEAVHAQLAAIVEGSHDAIFSRSLDGTVLSWNAGAERMFGYTAAEVIGRPISIIAPPELAHESQRNTAALLRGEPTPPFETVRIAKGGRAIQVQVSVSPIRDGDGKVSGVAGIMRDVTERKRAEEAVTESERRLATLMGNLPGMAYRCRNDPQWSIEFASQACRELTGYDAQDLIMNRAVAYADLILPEDRQAVWNEVQRAVDAKQSFTLEYRIRTATGQIKWVWEQGCGVFDAAGGLVALEGLVSDITKRKSAEAELKDVARLARLMESLARSANEAATPEAALRACLEHICAYGQWSLGHVALYAPGHSSGVAQTSLWHAQEPARYERIMRLSNDFAFNLRRGGFVGEALTDRKPVWVEDLSTVPNFGRVAALNECGLRAGFVLPVVVGGEVAAFLEFFAGEARAPDRLLMEVIGSVAAQLARLIERGRAEAANARLAAIVENSNDAIISRGLDRIILTWNAAAERLFGWTAAEMIGRDVSLIIPPDQVAQTVQNHALLVSGQPIPTHDAVRVTKDGRRIDVSITQFPITGADGRFLGVSSILRDISERKRAQRELEQKAALSHLMESLARAANEAASAEEAMHACLERICAHGAWTIGRLGIYGPGKGERFPERSLWHPKEPVRYEPLMRASLDPKYFAFSGKFISVVLKEKRPVWIGDIASAPGFGRMAIALECKLRSAFAFPVIVGGEVAAFIEFFAEEPREPDALLLEAVTSVAAQLARLIERYQAETTRAQLAAIVENSDDAIISRDLDRRITTWNAAAERLFGYSMAEVIGRNISFLIPPDQEAQAAQVRAQLASGQAIPAYDTVRLTRDGRRIDVSVTQSPIKDAEGSVIGVSLIFRDITKRKEAEEQIRQLAHHDSLTGLPNRALFYDRLGQAVALARREEHAAGLLYLDLDDFKAVNDTLGHDAGDELLKSIADRMRSCLRESDTIARVGGDEFVVILQKIAGREVCAVVATKLLAALAPPFRVGGDQRETVIGVSIGIAVFPADAKDMESLVKAADSAMYAAKQEGNRFSFHEKPARP